MKLDNRSSLCVQAILCVLALCIAILISASITVSGTVKDGDGNAVDNARVWISNGTSGDLVSSYTDSDGAYSLNALLDAGSYDIHAKYGEPDAVDSILVEGDGQLDKDFVLQDLHVKPTATPTPTPRPSPGSSGSAAAGIGGYQQVKYSRVTNNMYPVIQINLSWKRAYKFEPIAFDAGSTYDPDGYIALYEWDFGDGSTGEGASVQHAYKEVGKYSVKFRVVDNGGAERSAYVTAIISSKPPVSIPGNDTNATVGAAVQFNGSGSYDPDGKIVKYEWSFGDGSVGQGVSVTHVFTRPDKYKVELNVTDDDGLNSTAYLSVDVASRAQTPAPAGNSGSTQGIALLAGLGIACVAVMALMRKKSK